MDERLCPVFAAANDFGLENQPARVEFRFANRSAGQLQSARADQSERHHDYDLAFIRPMDERPASHANVRGVFVS